MSSIIGYLTYINNRLENVKIIVAIREDLLSRVFRHTREIGDQEEKYASLYLRLYWSDEDLEKIVDLRVNKLIQSQYTNSSVSAREILPVNVQKQPTLEYIIERTLRNPRDIIAFLNECLNVSAGKATITPQIIQAAENEYSQGRLKALGDEWSDYVDLVSLILLLLKQLPAAFQISEIENSYVEKQLMEFLSPPRNQNTYTYQWIYNGISNPRELFYEILKEFHKIGVIGIKPESYTEYYWSFLGKSVTRANLTEDTRCRIHLAFHRVLGVKLICTP
jgi:hypothetical protein